MSLFLAIILQMGYDMQERLGDHWTRTESFFTPFCSAMTQDRFLHLVNCLYVTDSDEEVDKNGESYYRTWKIIEI
jgi:hypothetical protein